MIGTILTVGGLVVAIWQLFLQRQEIKRDGKVNALFHLATMIDSKIAFNEKMISDFKVHNSAKKSNQKDWVPLAKNTNEVLRPLLKVVNKELFATMDSGGFDLDLKKIHKALGWDEKHETN